MKNPFLAKMEGFLDEAGYMSVWNQESEVVPFQYLSVTLPLDSKGRNRNLIVKVEQDAVTMPFEDGHEHKETLVQMVCFFPFNVSEGNIWEVLRIINFFNNALPTPGLIYDEGAKRVFFRYTFHKPTGKYQKEYILSLVGMVLLWMDAVSTPIEETCSGKTMMDVIKGNLTSSK